MKETDTKIITPDGENEYSAIAALMREFHQWCCARYAGERNWEFKDYFDETVWNHELDSLEEYYIPPTGELLLALQHSEPAGCIALKQFSISICELKRLFVNERFRGQGVARQLVSEILEKAKIYGYDAVRLEFVELFVESKSLYTSMGFKNIEAYTDIPERLKPKMEFMELQL